jgi:superfamily II DNA helicase RecQ
MTNSIPPPGSPNIVPPGVTNAEINIANEPLSSPVPPDVGFDDWTAADTEHIVAMSGCSDDRLRACIVAASSSVWGVQEMYPTQIDSVFRLLHPVRPNNLAAIQQTGAGKTHILRMLGVMERGIVLIVIPLLTLSADVMSKFTCADQRFGTVMVQHLGELYDGNKKVYHELLERCHSLQRSTTTTVFIFLSPQFLINHPDARDVFIACSHRATLRVVAIDKAHIHVQHGTSFRGEIHAFAKYVF